MKRLILFILLSISFNFYGHGQALKSYVPPSPTAASLGIYGDIPVSYYNGLPNISVPLFNIPLSGLDFACDLNYSADGLKIFNESSSVGLHWSITNTAMITRNLRLLDDFSANGYFKVPPANRTLGSGKDLEPDIFNYYINGRAGKFLIDYSSSSYIIRFIGGAEDLKVEIINGDNFRITDTYGNIYRFDKKEYQSQKTGSSSTVNYISAWYLTSIETVNKDVMTITYKQNTPKVIHDYTSNTTISVNPPYTAPDCAYRSGGAIYELMASGSSSTSTHTETDEILVDEISYRGGKVSFSYMYRIDLRTNGTPASSLNNITIRNNQNAIIKYIGLDYSYFYSPGGGSNAINTRLKLNKIYVNTNSNAYHFIYNEQSQLPPKSSSFGKYYAIDPTLGLLKKLYYPTGGYTEFEYERHQSRFGQYSFSENKGARILRIINKEVDNSVLQVTRFDYTKPNGNTRVSSGLNLSLSLHSFQSISYGNCDGINFTFYYSRDFSENMLPSEYGNPNGYDEVTVYQGENGENGKSTYYYRNVVDVYPNGIFPGGYGARDVGNGMLLSEEHYKRKTDGTFSLISKKDFEYEGVSLVTVSGAKIIQSGLSYYHVYTGTYRPINEKEYVFNDNAHTIEKETTYAYNGAFLQPKHIVTTASNGDVIKIIKRNAYDMVQLGQYTPYQQMVNNNMLAQIIEEEKQVNNATYYKSSTQYSNSWTANSNLILPSLVKTQYRTEPAETRIQYHNYDNVGNPLMTTIANDLPKSYKWGYNQKYLVGEFTNAGSNEYLFEDFEGNGSLTSNSTNSHTGKGGYSGTIALSNLFSPSYNGKSYLLSYFYYESNSWHHQQVPYNGQTISGILDDITIYPSNGKVSTYTYEPGLGLSSSIDVSGNTTFYEYDFAYRLKAVRDQNKHIVKAYDYNYVLFSYHSNQKSKYFTKNDCLGNTSAAPVLFIVPSGQFTSTTSQEHADLLAENYLNENGQAYANANGVCTPTANYEISYTVDPYFGAVSYTITKSFDDEKRALCKIRIRYDPINMGGALTETILEIQMENGMLTYSDYMQINAATTCEVEILEIIEN